MTGLDLAYTCLLTNLIPLQQQQQNKNSKRTKEKRKEKTKQNKNNKKRNSDTLLKRLVVSDTVKAAGRQSGLTLTLLKQWLWAIR